MMREYNQDVGIKRITGAMTWNELCEKTPVIILVKNNTIYDVILNDGASRL